MNLKQAQYVLAIVEAGSMAAASRELHVTQPALSQVVKTDLPSALQKKSPALPGAAGEQVMAYLISIPLEKGS